MYSLFALLTIASWYGFVRLRSGSHTSTLGYIVGTVLLLYTHAYGLFVLASQYLYVALSERWVGRDLRKWLSIQAVVTALFSRLDESLTRNDDAIQTTTRGEQSGPSAQFAYVDVRRVDSEFQCRHIGGRRLVERSIPTRHGSRSSVSDTLCGGIDNLRGWAGCFTSVQRRFVPQECDGRTQIDPWTPREVT